MAVAAPELPAPRLQRGRRASGYRYGFSHFLPQRLQRNRCGPCRIHDASECTVSAGWIGRGAPSERRSGSPNPIAGAAEASERASCGIALLTENLKVPPTKPRPSSTRKAPLRCGSNSDHCVERRIRAGFSKVRHACSIPAPLLLLGSVESPPPRYPILDHAVSDITR